MKTYIRLISRMEDYIRNSMTTNADEERIKHELICEAILLSQAKYDLYEASMVKKVVDKIYNKHGESMFHEENSLVLRQIIKEIVSI